MPFYIREAWLLDERKLKEWLDLFTDDVLCFLLRRKNVPRPEAHRELTPLGHPYCNPAVPDARCGHQLCQCLSRRQGQRALAAQNARAYAAHLIGF
jgi:hypothetical protein